MEVCLDLGVLRPGRAVCLPKDSNLVAFLGQYITVPKKNIAPNRRGTTCEPSGRRPGRGIQISKDPSQRGGSEGPGSQELELTTISYAVPPRINRNTHACSQHTQTYM